MYGLQPMTEPTPESLDTPSPRPPHWGLSVVAILGILTCLPSPLSVGLMWWKKLFSPLVRVALTVLVVGTWGLALMGKSLESSRQKEAAAQAAQLEAAGKFADAYEALLGMKPPADEQDKSRVARGWVAQLEAHVAALPTLDAAGADALLKALAPVDTQLAQAQQRLPTEPGLTALRTKVDALSAAAKAKRTEQRLPGDLATARALVAQARSEATAGDPSATLAKAESLLGPILALQPDNAEAMALRTATAAVKSGWETQAAAAQAKANAAAAAEQAARDAARAEAEKERAFIASRKAACEQYRAAKNEIQASAIYSEYLDAALARRPAIRELVGKVTEIDTPRGGAYVEVTVETEAGSFSNKGALIQEGMNFKAAVRYEIAKGSPMYRALGEIAKGSQVRVSVAEVMPLKGITERGTLCGDDWIARFVSITQVTP